MGAYKGGDARYNVISTRVDDRQFGDLQKFAADRKIDVAAAVRMLLAVGIEFLSRGDVDAR